ncbi:MAG: hypothetical protein E6G46_00380, partial [Actinobacteria bacterium]
MVPGGGNPGGYMRRQWKRTFATLLLTLSVVSQASIALADTTPSPSASPSTDATATASPDASAQPSATSSPTPSVSDSPTPVASDTPSPAVSDSVQPTLTPTPTTPTSPSPSPTTSTPSDHLIIRLIAGLTSAEQQSVIARHGGTETSSIPALRLHFVDVAGGTANEALTNFQSDADVVSADLDATRTAEAVPSDTVYPSQWALPHIGWDQAFGTVAPAGSSTIAVLDTGVDASVSDLSGRLTGGYSALGGNPTTDANGHGTWLASIAAAGTDNADGIAGVDYASAQIMPVQVVAADGTGQDSDIISGVVWAADHGADVILMAFSNPTYSSALQDAVDYAWSKGAVIVAATGNDSSSVAHYPAGDSKVIGVSATNSSDELWSGSNYGPDTFLAAPGVDIAADSGSGTQFVTGTSASAAIVAGAAALLKANDPSASNGVIVGRLARTADAAATAD